MDPNENLRRQLEQAQRIIDLEDKGSVVDSGAVELAELVEDLSDWLEHGGFAPQKWWPLITKTKQDKE